MAKSKREIPFAAHMYDRKLEWRLLDVWRRHQQHQILTLRKLLAECWQAGLSEEEINLTIDRYFDLPPGYSISYLRGMLIDRKKRTAAPISEVVW